MSETAVETDTTEAAEVEVETPPADENTGNREAAKYRVRAREAELERDSLAQRIETLQNREVERLAAKQLSNPADLMTLAGVTLADLLTDDGDVDAEKVSGVAADLLGTRPGLKPLQRATDMSQGSGGPPPKSTLSWGDLLR